MKILIPLVIIGYALLMMMGFACAAPLVVTCDPIPGAVEYGVACDGNITLTAPADASGAMLLDTMDWPGAYGTWVNCIVVACAMGSVIDDATTVETDGMVCSEPASFQIRIPANQNPQAFKIK